MKKIVLKAEINCEKCRREAYEAISNVEGVESATVDIKEKRVTVIGDADPACLTYQLRKLGWAELVSVGPHVVIKEEKKPPPKDDKKEVKDGKKETTQEFQGGKNGSKKDDKKDSTNKVQAQDINVYVRGFPEERINYNQTLVIRGGCNHCEDVYFLSDEDPNACSIC